MLDLGYVAGHAVEVYEFFCVDLLPGVIVELGALNHRFQ